METTVHINTIKLLCVVIVVSCEFGLAHGKITQKELQCRHLIPALNAWAAKS